MDKEDVMDKLFLLTYTCVGFDGFRHSCHAWFATEEALQSFVKKCEAKGNGFEVDTAIEILSHREVIVCQEDSRAGGC